MIQHCKWPLGKENWPLGAANSLQLVPSKSQDPRAYSCKKWGLPTTWVSLLLITAAHLFQSSHWRMHPHWHLENSWWDSRKYSVSWTQFSEPQKLWYNKRWKQAIAWSNVHVLHRKHIYDCLENLLKCSSLFQVHIYVRQNFLHTCPPKQHLTTDWIWKQICKSSLGKHQRCTKENYTVPLFSPNFYFEKYSCFTSQQMILTVMGSLLY